MCSSDLYGSNKAKERNSRGKTSGQSYKHFPRLNYNLRVVIWAFF